ncbi:hypothetical protein O181_130300 [Austropuccinia psidii MF-1]|uniref:Uncharacterized protein n=1 Tax=Austropuccinia psidii MF-1 TaxID=1389203 RepID=A0A9Q3QAV0_9BASI|nr:hypothetical protein [Austropuccinia psidii MF-1]
MSPAHLRSLGIPRNQPEDRQELSRNRRPGSGHCIVGKDIEGSHTHTVTHLPIQQGPQIKGIEVYGSVSSASPTPQRLSPIENGKQEVQPSFTLGIT